MAEFLPLSEAIVSGRLSDFAAQAEADGIDPAVIAAPKGGDHAC